MDSQDNPLSQDEHFKQLALKAKQHSRRSRERRQALTQLTQEILNSGRLCHPYPNQFVDHYQDIYELAVQNLMLHICVNIDQYKPDLAPVMRWVNFLLKKRFFPEAINEILSTPDPIPPDLPLSKIPPCLSDLVRQSIEDDSNGIFTSTHIQGYPQANFKELYRRRIIEQESWRQISQDLGIKVPTLSDFYQRSIRYFSSEIKNQIQN
ncbi:MAG: sigma-70 family RNA polymerase sigma factor [Cyanobacteriota bacterium]|nr:sigma-70 family RNA polymerase sigma factor [Cyanobacteriota bacterium]